MYLTARSSERGMAAVSELMKEGCTVHFHQLDIDDAASIERVRDFMKDKYGGIDVLVNNAAIAFKNAATEPMGVQVKHRPRRLLSGILHWAVWQVKGRAFLCILLELAP